MTPAEKGLQLMNDMGVAINQLVSPPTMPSDAEIMTTLQTVAKTDPDYSDKASNAVITMSTLLLKRVKEAISNALAEVPPRKPTVEEIVTAIQTAIAEAA